MIEKIYESQIAEELGIYVLLFFRLQLRQSHRSV